MAAAAAPQQQFLTAEQFLKLTKPKTVRVASATPYTDGGRTTIRLPQAGLAQTIWVVIQASIVITGTISSGTWKGWPVPAPFGMINRLKLASNNAFQLRDMNGWSLYKWIRQRYGIDPYPQVPTADPRHSFSVVNDRQLGVAMTNPIIPGAAVAAGTYLANLAFPIPVGYNNCGEQGLLVLQQNSTFYDLTIDWAAIAASGAGPFTNGLMDAVTPATTATVVPTITVTVGLDWFEPVPGIGKLVSMFMSVSDQIISPLVAGENIIRLPVNDYYTMMSAEFVNNGAVVAPTNLQNIMFQHSGNVVDSYDDQLIRLARNFYLHNGMPPVDGEIVWDFGLRRGNMQRRDTLDAFDNLNVTDAQLRVTIPSTVTITGVNQCSLVTESLRYIRQV